MKPKCITHIALDLDGTSVRYEPRLEMDPELIAYLASVQPRGIQWLMNSDRYTDNLIEIAHQLEPEHRPVAVLSCQRYIHMRNGGEKYEGLQDWNILQTELHKTLWEQIFPHFQKWQQVIESRFTIQESVVNDIVLAYMVPQAETPDLRSYLVDCIAPWSDAKISGNQDWTFILHRSFSKARILKRFAEVYQLASENIIAVGDGINDLSMLDGSVTPYVGCPVNAAPEVIRAVSEVGGFVADEDSAAGTMQVLQHYLE